MVTPENDSVLNYYKATVMLSGGRPPKPADALFFHSRSFGDYTGLYELIREMFEKQLIKYIAVTNNEGERVDSDIPLEANPGKTACIRCLTEEQHIPEEFILVPEMKAFHTRGENAAFVELSRQRGWTSGVILAQPHQLLRSMLGIVQEMDQSGYLMEIYTAAPAYVPWLEEVRGSQGVDLKPRIEHIADELQRTHHYQDKGHLATFEQLFTYLNSRERGSLRFAV